MVLLGRIGLILIAEVLLGFIITPIAVRLGHFHGLTDKPDNHLKLHADDTPHIGGLVVFVLVLCVSIAYHALVVPVTISQAVNVGLLFVIFIVGTIDDRYRVSIPVRLASQIAIAVILILFGNVFTPTDWPVVNIALTIFGVLAMINAVNMLDGMDGLASILSILAILGLVYTLYYYRVGLFYIVLGVGTIAALIPFLVANFRSSPKKAFLGDSGSTYLGLLIAMLFIKSTNAHGESDTAASLLFISIPLFELAFATMLRLWSKKNPLKGSKDHFPLKLRWLIKSDSKALVCISAIALFFFLAGVGMLHFSTVFKYVVLIVSAIVYLVIWIVLARVRIDE